MMVMMIVVGVVLCEHSQLSEGSVHDRPYRSADDDSNGRRGDGVVSGDHLKLDRYRELTLF